MTSVLMIGMFVIISMFRCVKLVKKRNKLYNPVLRKKKPKNSLKTGETKSFKFYIKGNRTYTVKK